MTELAIVHALGGAPPLIKVVDVGAMDLGSPTPYHALLENVACTVVGFEPNPAECAKLMATAPPSREFLPHFVGDGSKRTFHWCKWAATSSLYPPNDRLLRRFSALPELVQLDRTSEVQTTRLDDITGVRGADFIKIDVQGATLDVLRGGPETLADALVVQCEAEFVPLYEGEPLFAEIDQEMRKLGYLFHRFAGISGRTFAPLHRKDDSGMRGQMLWTDAVYVRSFLALPDLSPDQLAKLAVILDLVYGSHDFALLVLQHLDEKSGGDAWRRYENLLTGGSKEKPPLD